MTPVNFDLGHMVLMMVVAALSWLSAHGKGAVELAKKEISIGQDTLESLHAKGHDLLISLQDQLTALETKIDSMSASNLTSQIISQSQPIQPAVTIQTQPQIQPQAEVSPSQVSVAISPPAT